MEKDWTVSYTRDRTGSDGEQEDARTWGRMGGSHEGQYDRPLLTRAFEWPSPEPTASGSASAPSYEDRWAGRRDEEMRSEGRLLEPPQTGEGRHRSAPVYGADDWERRTSFGRLSPSSRVVLPPVSHLLGEVGMDEYAGGPVLPQLRLPDAAREEERGKRGREEEEKRPVRKIYVACDFCRGRKLRCDGGRPKCSNCDTRSLACKYQEHPRRRGPGKAPKGSRGKKAGRGR